MTDFLLPSRREFFFNRCLEFWLRTYREFRLVRPLTARGIVTLMTDIKPLQSYHSPTYNRHLVSKVFNFVFAIE